MVFGRRARRARKKPRMRCSHTGPECVLFFVVRAAEQIIQRYAEYFREREQVIKGGNIAVLFPGRRVARSDVEHLVRYPFENDGSRDGAVFLDLDVNIVVYTEFFGYL